MDILLMVIGALIGAGATWYFARSGSEELREYYVNTQTALKELAHGFGAAKLQLAQAAEALKPQQPDAAAKIEASLLSEAKKEKKIIATLPVSTQHEVEAELFSTLELCPFCGEESIVAGWRPTGTGSPMMHYRCEKHGLFPGARVSDMWDD